jgi:hypothetical protein
MIRKFCAILIGIIFIFVINLDAQEIKVDVTVNVEQLEFEARTFVSTMKRDIENYINNQKFMQNDWVGVPVPVKMTIFLSGGSNGKYSAKLFIVSTRKIDGPGDRQSGNVRFYDDKWSFEYGLGANLTFNPLRFDSFTSLLDYYMFLMIGFELDTWEELGGNQAFNYARQIVELGTAHNADGYSSYSNPGDFTRYNLTSELTNMRFNDLRKVWFSYYVDGLDLMATDKNKAMENLKNAIYQLALFKKNKLVESSVLMQLFFDSKAQEIGSIFNGTTDDNVFENLKYLDIGNATIYDDAKEGKLGGGH